MTRRTPVGRGWVGDPPGDGGHRDRRQASDGPMARYMILVLLFAAAAGDATPEQRPGLVEAKELLRTGAPLREVTDRVLETMGPEWAPPEEYLHWMESLGGTG